MNNKTKYIVLCTLLWMLCIKGFATIPLQKEIHTNWKFKQGRLNNWYPATVPGVVHTDLMNNGIIEDPFFRLNERGVQWIDKEDWIYETTFDLEPAIFAGNHIRILFKGLDTYADVFLNDTLIITANNMFREWKADIKTLVKEKGNRLRVYFHSPIKKDLPKWEALPFQYEAVNDQSQNGGLFNKKVSVFARKAGYHYGWDWGPRLVTSGIWRPVILEAWDHAKIEDIHIRQQNVSAQKATIIVNTEIIADQPMPNANIRMIDNRSGAVYKTVRTPLSKGKQTLSVDFTIANPQLWWSNGLGDPHLYEIKTEVSDGTQMLDAAVTKTGIRSLKVIHKPDESGEAFYVELNGIPVFSKGANYIPCDNYLPRVTREIYQKTVLDAANANMNMLRVWGGGIYEDDYFYELCDEYGIMVWQDFMFACSIYPSEGELLENIKQEAIDNVKRLRNHPSIALWCGNNECLEAWFGWGWKKQYQEKDPAFEKIIWTQYENLFHQVLPEVVADYHPESFYWPSSPFARYDGTSDRTKGDRHYWGVWHSRKPISEYNKERSRFFSEYGFQSFPEFESVKRYAPYPEDWVITSETMMAHQRGGAHANSLIETYLLNEYQKPKDFESFLYMNLVLQGDAIKTAIEAHRRDMPHCMGSLFWQHNDCWPVASWSSRDYYGRWKAQHYFAREAFRDILVSPIAQEDKLAVYIVSDRMESTKGQLKLYVYKLDGTLIFQTSKNLRIPANTSKVVYTESIDKFLHSTAKEEVVIFAYFTDHKGATYQNNYFLLKQKEVRFTQPTIQYNIAPVEGGYELTLESDRFARAVFLSTEEQENFFRDNYFDLLPQQKKRIIVESRLSLADFKKQLKIRSLTDSYADVEQMNVMP